MIVALFRVKLGRKEVALCYGRAKPLTVIGPPTNHRPILWNGVIGVNEIEKRAVRNTFKQFIVTGIVHPVPAHVWDLEPGFRIKVHDPAGDYIEATMNPELLTDGHEKLHTQTDPQKRFPPLYCTHYWSHKASFSEIGHAVPESSHAGKDHGVGRLYRSRIAGNDGIDPSFLEPFLGAPEVAHSVIHNDYGGTVGASRSVHSPSLPLVEGTSWTLGSMVTA